MARLSSKTLKLLRSKLENGDTAAIREFLKNVRTPIIEPHGPEKVLVTFIYVPKTPISSISVYGEFCGHSYKKNAMHYWEDAELWYKSYILPDNLASLYRFVINYDDTRSTRDPLNPLLFEADPNSSIMELPSASKEPYLQEAKNCGKIESFEFQGKKISIHETFGFDASSDNFNILILLDGMDYINFMSVPKIIDNMKEESLIKDQITIFVGADSDRSNEYSLKDDFNALIINDLFPYIEKSYDIKFKKENTYIAGFSLSGLAACYIGLKYTDYFKGIISQSGSFWYNPKKEKGHSLITKLYKEAPLTNIKFRISVGAREAKKMRGKSQDMVNANRMFSSQLLGKGYKVTYNEFPGGHDILCWRKEIPDILLWINKI